MGDLYLAVLSPEVSNQTINGILLLAGMLFFFYAGVSLYLEKQRILNEICGFSLERSKCFCCAVNHIVPDAGKAIECDRRLIQEHVEDLYGSIEGSIDLFERR